MYLAVTLTGTRRLTTEQRSKLTYPTGTLIQGDATDIHDVSRLIVDTVLQITETNHRHDGEG